VISENVADLIRNLQTYLEKIEYNPKRLEQVEERLDLLYNLQHKYGGSVEAVKNYAADTHKQLDTITHASERISELESILEGLKAELSAKAIALSNRRKQAGKDLGTAVECELGDLHMAGARFAVDIQHIQKEDGLPFSNGQL